MSLIELGPAQLALAAAFVLALAALSWRQNLGLTGLLLIAAARASVQLMLLGMVLRLLFGDLHPAWLLFVALIMLTVAAWEVSARQSRRHRGGWGYAIGGVAMFISSFTITLLALFIVIGVEPWYTPQYLVPLLGMMLGNTMNGVAISMERLNNGAWQARREIEAQLALGHSASQSIAWLRRDALRAGMIPIVNSMMTAGIVSLPGMMTGQILAGGEPFEAAKYQLMILFLITAGTGFGAIAAVSISARRLFDERARLRLDRLSSVK